MRRSAFALASLVAALSFDATAAANHPAVGMPAAPADSATIQTLGGTLEALPVLDRRTGASVSYFALRQADGTLVALQWLSAEHAQVGAELRVEGKRSADAFFVETAATLRKAPSAKSGKLPANARRYAGTLQVLYADDLDAERWERVYSLESDDGSHVPVRFPVPPEMLEQGMTIAVDGVVGADGITVDAHAIEIVADAPESADLEHASLSGTTQVLVILIKYQDTTSEPYTRENVQETMFTGASSVAAYFRETSYGKHAIGGAVTPWFTARFARPTTCNFSQVATEATYLAQQAGYNTASYQKFVYVFPTLPNCGWAGLGGGSQAWINQAASTKVIGHELGHTFGLGHASSLDCGTAVIGGTCSRSEYGDGYEIMGNSKAAHLNAPHKVQLGYLSSTQFRTHAGGTATYTMSALEASSGSTYAVQVPASARRTYWIEWRQPIGFDASFPTGITNGALLHIGGLNDFACETCLLDMTPATSGFGDAALAPGQTFGDAQTGASISVVNQTATSLTVQVSTPPRPSFSDVPPTSSAYAAVEAIKWSGITNGCAVSPLRYCPEKLVTRAEMAVFMERAMRGADAKFPATGTRFADVPLTYWAAGFIEQLFTDGITAGCASNPMRYCPDQYISRAQMAPYLLKAKFSSSVNPGPASGTVFADVPKTHPMAAWIERLYQYGVTAGCSASPRMYCPDGYVTRAQMALFMQRAFNLPAPPI